MVVPVTVPRPLNLSSDLFKHLFNGVDKFIKTVSERHGLEGTTDDLP